MRRSDTIRVFINWQKCHSEPFAPCHSEGAKGPKNLAQHRLREESKKRFFARRAQNDK